MKKIILSVLLSIVISINCSAVFAATSDNEPAISKNQVDTDSKTQKKTGRYVLLFSENSMGYFMDVQTAHWIPCPNFPNEYIIDVWIKMIPGSEQTVFDSSYKAEKAQQYYLEHYYIRPSQQQIQFLVEMEVKGRPDNNVKQREYSSANWENLVPGSLEDEIYNGVVREMKKYKSGSSYHGRNSSNNIMEELFRISM